MAEPMCSCTSQEKKEGLIELMKQDGPVRFLTQAHVIKFGNLELYAFERAGILHIPLDTIMQIIGTAANKAFLTFVSAFDIKLFPLESSEIMLLQQKCGFNENISCLDLISIEDFQQFCKKFTSSNLCNPVIVEFALNSPCEQNHLRQTFCAHCGMLNGNELMKMNDNAPSLGNIPVIVKTAKNEYDLTEMSVGFLSVGNSKMDAFTLKDQIYLSFRDIVMCNVLQLTAIQKGMRELHVLPITAPTEINNHLKNSNKLSCNSFWVDVETVHNLVIMLKKRRKRSAVDPSLVPCIVKREYEYFSVAMVTCRNVDLTIHSFAIDSKSLELVNMDTEAFNCVIQKDEPFLIMDKRANARKLTLHRNCAGCNSKKNSESSVKQKPLKPIAKKKEMQKKSRMNPDAADQSNCLSDVSSALVLEPGDYIIRDYDQFCELFKSNMVVENNSSSSNVSFAIDSEDQVAVKFIESETDHKKEIGNVYKDENNNIVSEAMQICGINETDSGSTLIENENGLIDNLSYGSEKLLASQITESEDLNLQRYLKPDTIEDEVVDDLSVAIEDAPDLSNPTEGGLNLPITIEDRPDMPDTKEDVSNLPENCHIAGGCRKVDQSDEDIQTMMEKRIRKYLVFSRVNDVFRFEKFNDGAKTTFPALFWPTSDHLDTLHYRRNFIKTAEAHMTKWFNKSVMEKTHENSDLDTKKILRGSRKCHRQRTKKMSDDVRPNSGTSNMTFKGYKEQKKRKHMESNQVKEKSKCRYIKKSRRVANRSATEERSLDESFRIEIFETKGKPKIMLRNWNNFSELVKKSHKKKTVIHEIVESVRRRSDNKESDSKDNGLVKCSVSGNVNTIPNLVKSPCFITDTPQRSAEGPARPCLVTPMGKIKTESVNNSAGGAEADLNCYVRLTRMKWLDKLSQKYISS